MSQYERYRADATVLAAIGVALRGQVALSVLLPEPLRAAAVAAWQRDEQAIEAQEETEDQRRVRDRSATLALIGLAISRAGGADVISIHPKVFAAAVAASQDD